jgi:predicted DNA-binding ribbon-helix-helix protein
MEPKSATVSGNPAGKKKPWSVTSDRRAEKNAAHTAYRRLRIKTARAINAAQPKMRPRSGRPTMKSPVVKRSIVVAGHKTSVSLEDAFWKGLREIAAGRHMTLSDLVASIDSERQHGNLSSAVRLFVLGFYREQISEYEKRGRTREMLASAGGPPASKPGN